MRSKKITEKAYAKINLFLSVTSLREDGYHILSTLMQTVSLYDTVTVKKSQKLSVVCGNIPKEKNVAYKAVKELEKAAGKEFPAKIKIKKKIPSEAGLGGGSADAAASMRAIIKLYDINISDADLIKAAEKAGADVPFLLYGGAAVCKGIGEVLEPQPIFPDSFIVIAKPGAGNSTPQMFKKFDEAGVFCSSPEKEFCEGLKKGDLKALCTLIKNDLTPFDLSGEVKGVIESFSSLGAMKAEMSGSGTAVFAVFDDKKKAIKAAKKLRKNGLRTYITKPV